MTATDRGGCRCGGSACASGDGSGLGGGATESATIPTQKREETKENAPAYFFAPSIRVFPSSSSSFPCRCSTILLSNGFAVSSSSFSTKSGCRMATSRSEEKGMPRRYEPRMSQSNKGSIVLRVLRMAVRSSSISERGMRRPMSFSTKSTVSRRRRWLEEGEDAPLGASDRSSEPWPA